MLFVCSANVLDTISSPVYDRLETIVLSGYTMQEKKEIAKKHLLPIAIEKAGLADFKIEVNDKCMTNII